MCMWKLKLLIYSVVYVSYSKTSFVFWRMLRQAPSPLVYPSWLCCIPPNLLKFKNKGRRRSAAALPPVRHARVGEGLRNAVRNPQLCEHGGRSVSMGGTPVWAWGDACVSIGGDAFVSMRWRTQLWTCAQRHWGFVTGNGTYVISLHFRVLFWKPQVIMNVW